MSETRIAAKLMSNDRIQSPEKNTIVYKLIKSYCNSNCLASCERATFLGLTTKK